MCRSKNKRVVDSKGGTIVGQLTPINIKFTTRRESEKCITILDWHNSHLHALLYGRLRHKAKESKRVGEGQNKIVDGMRGIEEKKGVRDAPG